MLDLVLVTKLALEVLANTARSRAHSGLSKKNGGGNRARNGLLTRSLQLQTLWGKKDRCQPGTRPTRLAGEKSQLSAARNFRNRLRQFLSVLGEESDLCIVICA